MEKNILVTKPFLPELNEFLPYLKEIWRTKILSNCGHFHKELEIRLADFLNVPYVSLFCNGTLALITALKVLKLKGEVITTPFTFAATTHAISFLGLKPVFADVDPLTGNILPEKIVKAISSKTSAILPVHVYGNPCSVNEIDKIASEKNIKVIYDAAHAFGVKINSKSVLSFGDLSVLSFHATKCFNTFEGGAIVCHDLSTKKAISSLKNFGFTGEITFDGIGINAKMNEFQAALGLLQLEHFDSELLKRKRIFEKYRDGLKDFVGIQLIEPPTNVVFNYSYLPIIVNAKLSGISREELYLELKSQNIFTRRYFYPLISNLELYKNISSASKSNLPNANKLDNKILCLPIYSDLSISDVERILLIIGKLIQSRKKQLN